MSINNTVLNEVMLSHVRTTAMLSTTDSLQKVILLEDDSFLVYLGGAVHYLSQQGECLNKVTVANAFITLFDQETLLILENWVIYGASSKVSSWNFRTGAKSTWEIGDKGLTCFVKSQLRGHSSTTLLAGTNYGEVYLMSFPALQLIHTFDTPTTMPVERILPLIDGDSFVCGFSFEALVIYRRGTSSEGEREEQQ